MCQWAMDTRFHRSEKRQTSIVASLSAEPLSGDHLTYAIWYRGETRRSDPGTGIPVLYESLLCMVLSCYTATLRLARSFHDYWRWSRDKRFTGRSPVRDRTVRAAEVR
jgi:hypothetical protein